MRSWSQPTESMCRLERSCGRFAQECLIAAFAMDLSLMGRPKTNKTMDIASRFDGSHRSLAE